MITACRSVRLMLLFLPLVVWAGPALGQQQIAATMTVDGFTNPAGIPDQDAYLAVFRMIVANTTISETDKIGNIGFTDPNDVNAFTSDMNSFALQQTQAQTGPDLVALANKIEAQLQANLTAAGLTIWQNYVSPKKQSMQLYSFGNCKNTIYTYYESLFDSYDLPDEGEFEPYSDSAYLGGCVCNLTPISSTLLYNGGSYTGTKTKTAMSVSATWNLPNTGSYDSPLFGSEGDQTINITYLWGDCSTIVSVRLSGEHEFAKSYFARYKGVAGTNCEIILGKVACDWPVGPNCSNCSKPDYMLYVIHDYQSFYYWGSVGSCWAVIWWDSLGNKHRDPWFCAPIKWYGKDISTWETSDPTPGLCKYNPPY